MLEAGAEPEFVPFVPRRLVSGQTGEAGGDPLQLTQAQATEPLASDARNEDAPNAEVGGQFDRGLQAGIPAGALSPSLEQIVADQSVPASAQRVDTSNETSGGCVSPGPACADRILGFVRNEAVRLAAVACGRALRRVAIVHPATIAAFVDEALEACGGSDGSEYHVAPDDATQCEGRYSPVRVDPLLERGDFNLVFDRSSLGADIQTRAELLVRAAAENG